jgi:hypothetical protein
MQRAGTWPASPTVPGAPTSVAATARNSQVALAWTAPASNGGFAITDYVVQFSSNSGSTWTTFADGTSASTSATVTGLTNGTSYIFRVAAANAIGQGSYSSASSGATPVDGDPYFSSVSLLLHFDGTNGSSAFTDSSGNNFSVSSLGGATISTAESRFGGSALLLDADNKGVQVPAGSAFAFGTGDFTVEAWVRRTSSASGFVYTQAASGVNYFVLQAQSNGVVRFIGTSSGGGTGIDGPSGTIAALNSWSHIAAVRKDGIVTVYCDGVGGTPAANNTNFSDQTYAPTVGRYTHAGATEPFRGYIDEFRVSKGVARYTAGFTPPAAPFLDY